MRMFATMLALVVLFACAPARSQTSLLPADTTSGFQYFDSVPGGTATIVPAAGPGFTSAIRITTVGTGEAIYQAQLRWGIAAPAAQGDVCLLTFWARKTAPADGRPIRAQVVFETDGGDYRKSVTASMPNDSAVWRKYAISFRVAETYAASGAVISFQFSSGPQTFELGGISCLNYGPNLNPATLPATFYYPGSEDTAPWRAEAAERIRAHRMNDLTISVVDEAGRAVPGAKVRVTQKKHAFRFGSAVAADVLVGAGANSETYRAKVQQLFNAVVIENHLKWPFWEQWARPDADAALNWLSARNIPVRGHNLVWPNWADMPPDCQGLSASALRSRIDSHFSQMLSIYRGRLYEWDVVNEPFSSFDVMGRIPGVASVPPSAGVLGNQELVRWFQNARAGDPATTLVLNDFGVLESYDENHRAYFIALVGWLLAQGAPVQKLGLQCHFDGAIVPIDELDARITQLAQFSLPMAATEFDVNILDEQLQAKYTRDVMTLIFSRPEFQDFMLWGFWENAHWLPQAAMYRQNWAEKPNGAAYRDLVFNQWWTRDQGYANAVGVHRVRAFKGEHTVEISARGMVSSQRITIGDQQANLRVVLRLAGTDSR
jgi:endo-1,4-beta-xylanase